MSVLLSAVPVRGAGAAVKDQETFERGMNALEKGNYAGAGCQRAGGRSEGRLVHGGAVIPRAGADCLDLQKPGERRRQIGHNLCIFQTNRKGVAKL